MQFVIVRRFLMFSLFLYALRLNLNLACTQRQPLTDSGMGLHLFASCCDHAGFDQFDLVSSAIKKREYLSDQVNKHWYGS